MTAPAIPARPTIYKGIQMRSRLEARYAAWLDSQRLVWEYEPQCFASEHGQYLPDFVVRDVELLGETCDVYIEVKPARLSRDDAADLMRRQESIWASIPRALILIEIATEPQPILRMQWTDGPGNYRSDWVRTSTGAIALSIPIGRSGWTTF